MKKNIQESGMAHHLFGRCSFYTIIQLMFMWLFLIRSRNSFMVIQKTF